MFDLADILETALRGGAAGVSFLLAFVLAGPGPGLLVRRFGAMFTFSTGVYVLLSGEASRALFAGMLLPVSFIAVFGPVFFWWFAAALFVDNLRWRWWRFAPLALLPMFHLGHVLAGPGVVEKIFWYAHIGLNTAMFLDGLRLALANAGDDLVNPRRRFRFAIAFTVAIAGLMIASAETINRNYLLPDALRMFHAAAIMVLNMVFAVWLLSPRMALFADPPAEPSASEVWTSKSETVAAADRAAYDRLMALMDGGAYREEGLSVALLAEKVGLPEHQLRKLINGALGFRNFSAFLNARRIEDAKLVLADPAAARKQILQIALDLGYGSIAPFNRAFKLATGQTPTEFRKAALGEG